MAMQERAPISIVIPTLNAGAGLGDALAALAPAAIEGLVREVVVTDAGSSDDTVAIAQQAGARVIRGAAGRGGQLARGAAAARGDWLLFLHADTILGATWSAEAAAHLDRSEGAAGVFTLRFDAGGVAPALVAAGAMLRTRLFSSPYGDQGLLISRSLYEAVGGFRPLPLFEDVDLIDRLVRMKGRGVLKVLKTAATTSSERYRRGGYARRVLKNAACLAMYRAGVAPAKIAEFYR